MPDLSTYSSKILADEDRPLFEEAVVSASSGALRGAYILIWLCCLESLKRKFRVASTRDGLANEILQLIESTESARKSVDVLILDKALEYEFINDVAHQKLLYIYSMRCVYGHPYESAPSNEEISNAGSIVVNEVLSVPTLHKKRFVAQLIVRLLENVNFLENSETSVKKYARDIAPRIHHLSYGHLVNAYSARLEELYDDFDLEDMLPRGLWFMADFLSTIGMTFKNGEEWHEYVLKCPKFSQDLLTEDITLFDQIGELAQSTVISHIIGNAKTKPSGLKRIEPLLEDGRLSESQVNSLAAVSFRQKAAAKMKLKNIYEDVISCLKSHNWYLQNDAVDYLKRSNRSSLFDLTGDQQEILGRNILQASDGDSGSSNTYLEDLVSDYSDYPEAFMKGILFEGFVNENNEFRTKPAAGKVLSLFSEFPLIKDSLIQSIDQSRPSVHSTRSRLDDFIVSIVEDEQIKEYLVANKERLISS